MGAAQSGRSSAVAISEQGMLAFVLFAQRLFVDAVVSAECLMQHERDENAGDDRQAHLIVDGGEALAPSLGLREVVFPGIETLFFVPTAREQKGDDPGLQIEVVGEELDRPTAARTKGDDAPQRAGA